MSDYKPSVQTKILMLASFFAFVLPAILFTGKGYVWFIEHDLKLNVTTKPEGFGDRLLEFLALLPMIPLMVLAIFVVGIPWMFLMSRVLSWEDLHHFAKQKGPRFPFLSTCVDRLWLRMIESKGRRSPPEESSR